MATPLPPPGLAAATPPMRPPPAVEASWQGFLRRHFFDGPFNSLMTVGLLWVLFVTLPRLVDWAIVDAVWSAADPRACLAAQEFIISKLSSTFVPVATRCSGSLT